MKRLIPILMVALVIPASAQVITTLKSYRKGDIPPLPPGYLVRADDGTLYGMDGFALYKWQPGGSDFTILKQLSPTDPDHFIGPLALSGSTLYGATSTGIGLNGSVLTVFKMNTDGTGYTILKDEVSIPQPAGIVLSGDTLYGWGFKINTDGTGYTELAGFPYRDPDLGNETHLDILVSGNQIFGATTGDGAYGAGTVFRLNTDGTGYTVLVDIPPADASNIADFLTLAGNTLYGTSFGSTAKLFKVNTDGTGYSVVKDDFSSNGETLSVGSLKHSDGFLFGTTSSFTNNQITWSVFKMNTDGTDYTVLKRFTQSTNPPATSYGTRRVNILTVVEGAIYGVAESPSGFDGAEGGLDGRGGALFKMNTDGSGFTVLHEFMVITNFFPEGRLPGPLTVSDGVVYGVDHTGEGLPRVFKMNTDGTGFTILKADVPTDTLDPTVLLTLSGSTLFWIGGGRGALGNGDVSLGRIFRMNTDGAGYAVVKEFISPDTDPYGISPATLAVSGNTIYGTSTSGDVEHLEGVTIFKLNTDGTGFEVLHTFSPATIDPVSGEWTNSDGIVDSELTLSSNTLYGTASRGGQFGYGTVFKLNTDGTGFTVLKHFKYEEARNLGPLLTLSGDTLYGTSGNRFLGDPGVVFRLNTDGSGFSILKQFSETVWDDALKSWTNSDGAVPQSGAVWGNTFYGTTLAGGRFGLGTIFKINTDGTGFTVIAHNGTGDRLQLSLPHFYWLSPLVLEGSTLYGSGGSRGNQGAGAIFRIDLTPALSIGRTGANSLAVTWPSVWTDYVLQQNTDGLSSLNWSNVTDSIQNDGTNKTLLVSPTGGRRFYRLIQP